VIRQDPNEASGVRNSCPAQCGFVPGPDPVLEVGPVRDDLSGLTEGGPPWEGFASLECDVTILKASLRSVGPKGVGQVFFV